MKRRRRSSGHFTTFRPCNSLKKTISYDDLSIKSRDRDRISTNAQARRLSYYDVSSYIMIIKTAMQAPTRTKTPRKRCQNGHREVERGNSGTTGSR